MLERDQAEALARRAKPDSTVFTKWPSRYGRVRIGVALYRSLAGKIGFPEVYWPGQQDDLMALVFKLLGPNLGDLFR